MRRTIFDHTPDGLRQRLADMERQIADLQRVRNPPPAYVEPTGEGGYPWLLVAASDAPAKAKAVADYVCDGTDDHVEIQSAIDDMMAYAATTGDHSALWYVAQVAQRVVLTSGTFVLGDAVTIGGSGTSAAGGICIEGQGAATRLRPSSTKGHDCFVLADRGTGQPVDFKMRFASMWIGDFDAAFRAKNDVYEARFQGLDFYANNFDFLGDGTSGTNAGFSECLFSGNSHHNTVNACILDIFSAGGSRITGCEFNNVNDAIYIYDALRWVIEGNSFIDASDAIQMFGDHRDCVIANNSFWGIGSYAVVIRAGIPAGRASHGLSQISGLSATSGIIRGLVISGNSFQCDVLLDIATGTGTAPSAGDVTCLVTGNVSQAQDDNYVLIDVPITLVGNHFEQGIEFYGGGDGSIVSNNVLDTIGGATGGIVDNTGGWVTYETGAGNYYGGTWVP